MRWLHVATLMAMLAGPVSGGQDTDPLLSGVRHTFTSPALGEARDIWVSTPPGFDPQLTYPAVYVLDAETHFARVVTTVRFFAQYLRVPDLLVIGIPNGNRQRDFTPTDPSRTDGRTGGADAFLGFLENEVRPFVDSAYGASPFTTLIGHSLGGLFSIHALTERAGFDAYLAISPSLYWADSTALRALERHVSANPEHLLLYLGLAERERSAITTTTESAAAALENNARPDHHWQLDRFANENHLTVPFYAIPAGLRWLFDGWVLALDGAAARMIATESLEPFDRHYRRLSDKLGYPVRAQELTYSMVGDRLYRREAYDQAIALFEQWTERYPRSPRALDELARTLQAAGRRDEALVVFERAEELAESQEHPLLPAIRSRLERLRSGR